MSNKFVKKIINVGLLLLFILLSVMSGLKIFEIYKNSSSLDEFKNALSNEKNDIAETNDELNIPISETDTEKNESTASESFNNTGAKYDKDTETNKLEIINLEILSKVIPTDANQLYEVYHSTLMQVSSLISGSTYSYIDESTVSYKNSVLKFALLNYSNDDKISDITINIKSSAINENSDVITEFTIENLELLKEFIPKKPDYLLYAYQTITNEVKKDNPKSKGCSIDKESISKGEKSISFNVLDLVNKSKIKTITLKY